MKHNPLDKVAADTAILLFLYTPLPTQPPSIVILKKGLTLENVWAVEYMDGTCSGEWEPCLTKSPWAISSKATVFDDEGDDVASDLLDEFLAGIHELGFEEVGVSGNVIKILWSKRKIKSNMNLLKISIMIQSIQNLGETYCTRMEYTQLSVKQLI